ncbi:hypothetical protein OO184_15035 [Photorhabdus sp. APURE]|uniref:hypothetical protein n=1 Tax=Photorhabdus aballayi TaxID=2991723 RepID=UPI00223CCDC8|nr:hypothetical protein [Photorhabdus aballayi]MCW7549211.1 hypothetical protein [Photorhabdus aballayi]
MSNCIAIVSLIVGGVAAYYAWKAYSVSKELTFPKKNAHKTTCYVRQLTKESCDFNNFLQDSIHRRVYINIYFNSDDVDYAEFPAEPPFNVSATMTIWIDNFKQVTKGESLNALNSTSLYIQICDDFKHHLYWETGGYRMQGYFAVVAHGMKQGQYGTMLRPLSIQ